MEKVKGRKKESDDEGGRDKKKDFTSISYLISLTLHVDNKTVPYKR